MEEQTRSQPAASDVPGSEASGGLNGRVYDRDRLVAGATVVLTEAGAVTSSGISSEDGSFELSAEPGRYEIDVSAKGYRTSNGSVVLDRSPRPTTLDVELRRLDEATPRGVESVPQTTLRRWLELGNDLLAQGEGAAAEVEFRKALQLLQGSERHDVQRAIARARWLQQDVDGTLDELELAMAMEFQDGATTEQVEGGVSFQLLDALLQSLERRSEAADRVVAAERRLQELEKSSRPAPRQAPQPLPEPRPAVSGRTGHQHVRFDAGQKSLALSELRQRLGKAHFPEGMPTPKIDLSKESLSLFVPPDAASGAGDDQPWGLLVWVSPVPRGDFRPDAELERILGERRLIWAGAHNSGNQRPSWQRAALALATAELAQSHFDISPERVYVAGYSGGGRLATALAWRWPETFAGGVFWMGCDYHRPIAVPFHPGGVWAPRFPEPTRGQRRQLEGHRMIYVTGDRDFNRSETRVLAEAAFADGFGGARFLRIPDADHYFGLQAEWLGLALRAVDGEEVEGLRVPERWPPPH